MEQAWRWFGPDDPVTLDHVRQAGATGSSPPCITARTARSWPDDEVLRRQARDRGGGAGLGGGREHPGAERDQARRGGGRAGHGGVRRFAARGRPRRHQDRLLQFHAGGRLDPHRPDCGACPAPAMRCGSMRSTSPPTTCSSFAAPARRRTTGPRYWRGHASGSPPWAEASRRRSSGRSSRAFPASPARSTTAPGSSGGLRGYAGMTAADLRASHVDVPARGHARGRGSRRAAGGPSRRSAVPAVRPAARGLDRGDLRALFLAAVDSLANGLTFCAGSLGSRADNDVPALAREFGAAHPLRPSAQRDHRAGRLVLRGRAPRRRRRTWWP